MKTSPFRACSLKRIALLGLLLGPASAANAASMFDLNPASSGYHRSHLISTETAGSAIEVTLSKMNGISVGYTYRALLMPSGPLSEDRMMFHIAHIGLMGNLEEGDPDNRGGMFGMFGGVVGFIPSPENTLVEDGLFGGEGRRLIGIPQGGQLALAGGRIRLIGGSRHPSSSIMRSYIYGDIEVGALFPTFTTAQGALGTYELQEERISGTYGLFHLGGKISVIDFYGGVGVISDFFEKGFSFDAPKEGTIKNPPDSTWHLLLSFGVGMTFDFYSTS